MTKPSYQEWEAAEIFCSKCQKATRVRKRLLLILPDSDKYDYVCCQCGQPVGSKIDKKPHNF